MASLMDFDTIFHFNNNYSYDGKTIEQILSNRRSLENQLFVDRLLALSGVRSVSKLYPPKSNDVLRQLVNQIVEDDDSPSVPDHQKQALIYYLLKDCRGTPDAASQFARRCHLPERYKLVIEGLWYLDRLEFRRALENLTEPSLIPTFDDDILYVLTLSNLPKHDDSLVMAYYLSASPPLASEKVRKAFFSILCKASITDAFYFTRKYDEAQRQSYLEQLIIFVLKRPAGQSRSERAMELINLPFNEKEEQWFEEALLRGGAKTLHGAKDTVMMRRLAMGKADDMPRDLEALSGKKIDGLNWYDLKQSIRHSHSTLSGADYGPV